MNSLLADAALIFLMVISAVPAGAQRPAQPQGEVPEQVAPYLKPQLPVRIQGGRTINLVCLGQGSPTVVLTAGMGGWSLVWNQVQGSVSRKTRVCAWDPAGLGFSSASSEPQDAMHKTEDLEEALEGARVNGPYVMVAHSAGGYVALTFTDHHRRGVVGMVLVDPAIPDEAAVRERVAPKFAALGDVGPSTESKRLRQCAADIRSGALKQGTAGFDACTAEPLPDVFSGLSARLARLGDDPARLMTKASAIEMGFRSGSEVVNPKRNYGDMPLIVLTAGRHPTPPSMPADVREQATVYFRALASGHDAYAALSTRGRNELVPDSGHFIQLDNPAAVTKAIDEVLAQIKPQPPDHTRSAGPAVEQLKRWIAAYDNSDWDIYREFLRTDFAPDAANMFEARSLRRQTGAFDLLRIEKQTPTEVIALLNGRDSDKVGRIVVEVEPEQPHLICKLQAAAIPRPVDLALPHLKESELIASLRERLDEARSADTFSGAVLLAKDGKPIFEQAYGFADREHQSPNSLATRFRMGSMNKMFTAVAILQLVSAGKLRLDDPVIKYLPDYSNRDLASRVTIRELLSHTGGTGDFFGPEFDKHRLELRTHEDYIELFGRRPVRFEPGSRFEYSNYGFILLGAVIEKVSGESYYDFVRDHIYRVAGMTSTGSEPEGQVWRISAWVTRSKREMFGNGTRSCCHTVELRRAAATAPSETCFGLRTLCKPTHCSTDCTRSC
ncbi:MAG: alpha/beta fold hydrolase [Acidobacteriaceae bacterium]|nr:alpha/beta fold hydrolase [Acidobacteriaceae bacterium]